MSKKAIIEETIDTGIQYAVVMAVKIEKSSFFCVPYSVKFDVLIQPVRAVHADILVNLQIFCV